MKNATCLSDGVNNNSIVTYTHQLLPDREIYYFMASAQVPWISETQKE